MNDEQLVQLITDLVIDEFSSAMMVADIGSVRARAAAQFENGRAGATAGDGDDDDADTEKNTIAVGLSNRHLHISGSDLDALFGDGYALTALRELTQPGQFAAKETVDLVGPKRTLYGVRILGPPRERTQIEISPTDGYLLGVHPPVRVSGDLEGTPGIHIIGPKGAVWLDEGVIVAARHIHVTPEDAVRFGVEDGQTVSVRIHGARPVLFDEVAVRVSPKYSTELHLDLDEGNAAYIKPGARAEIITDLCEELCGSWCKLQHWNGDPRHPDLDHPDYHGAES